MKEVIYNYDYLNESDITDVVTRIKALIINGDNILLGNEDNILQFLGGHLEKNETFEECLKREVMEESGIDIEDSKIQRPFAKVTYFIKDCPTIGKNKKAEIYYYLIKTDKEPNLDKVKYTEHEKIGNFKIEKVPLSSAIDIIQNNIVNNDRNKLIAPDMIMAIEEYLKHYQ